MTKKYSKWGGRMSNKHYKCMLVKRIEDNKPITYHQLGEMYITLREGKEKTQKFFRSARNLGEALDRAKKYNQSFIERGLGCVIAEIQKSGGQRQQVKRKTGKTHIRRKPLIKGKTVWRVYLKPDGNIYELDAHRLMGPLFKQET